MEPLLNHKSLAAWCMLTEGEWDILKTRKQFTSDDKKRSPLPADGWIMQHLHDRCGSSEGGQPIMGVYKPNRFTEQAYRIMQAYYGTTGTSELILVQYKISRQEALILTHMMYLRLQGNLHIALSVEELEALQIALQENGYTLSQRYYPEKIQREISESWDNIFHPNCEINYDSTDNVYIASCSIRLDQVQFAERVKQGEALFRASYRDEEDWNYYGPDAAKVARLSRHFLL